MQMAYCVFRPISGYPLILRLRYETCLQLYTRTVTDCMVEPGPQTQYPGPNLKGVNEVNRWTSWCFFWFLVVQYSNLNSKLLIFWNSLQYVHSTTTLMTVVVVWQIMLFAKQNNTTVREVRALLTIYFPRPLLIFCKDNCWRNCHIPQYPGR